MALLRLALQLPAVAGMVAAVRLRPGGEEGGSGGGGGAAAAHPAGPVYPWAGKNGDVLRTGKSSFAAPKVLEAGPAWSFHETKLQKWAEEHAPALLKMYPRVSDLIRATPLIDDDLNIYLSTVTVGVIYKFNPDGKMLWEYKREPGQQLPGIPAIMDGKLFSMSTSGEAFALDMKTGSTLWTSQAASKVTGDTWSVAAADGVVIVPAMNDNSTVSGGYNNRVVALRASDGSFMWAFDAPFTVCNLLVAIKDGSCVFSTSAGQVFRLDLQTGATIWKTNDPLIPMFTTGGSILGPDGSTIYTTYNGLALEKNKTAQHGMVAAYSFADGRLLWTRDVLMEANNAAAIGVLGSGPNARLSVVVGLGTNPAMPDPSNGILSGKGGDDRVGAVAALDAVSGQTLWVYQLPSWHGAALGDDSRPDICLPDAFSNPAIGGDGTVYVGHQSGLFYSIRDDDHDGAISGADVSTFQTGAAFQGSPGIADGMVVATCCDGMHVWRS